MKVSADRVLITCCVLSKVKVLEQIIHNAGDD